MTQSQAQGHRKWYKMLKVNSAYQHDRNVKNCLKSECVMSDFKVLPRKTASQLARHLVSKMDERNRIHRYICYLYGSTSVMFKPTTTAEEQVCSVLQTSSKPTVTY